MRKEVKTLALIGIIIVLAAVFGATYYRESVQSERRAVGTTDGPLVRPDSPTLGPETAPVTLVEFLDPECESCRAFSPTVKQILKDYDGRVRLVVRYMPLHPNSLLAAAFTEAAGEQGRYWEMQEMLFRRQPEWGERHGHGEPGHGEPEVRPSAPPAVLFEKYAMELGLDVERIKTAVAQNRYSAKLERDRQDGQSLGVTRTPTFFVNGRLLARFSEEDLRALIDEELKR
ncbi:MAG TPA: thioredoxin domain-containing protein [Blastocatellia bacterium]|nr:thioredoxin domain-containing protein [Blastocatellia bacterium]